MRVFQTPAKLATVRPLLLQSPTAFHSLHTKKNVNGVHNIFPVFTSFLVGLRVALEHAKVKDIFFIPEVHFAEEKPMLSDDDGWWHQVRSVILCRTCGKCRVRKETEGFTRKEWQKKRQATCIECDGTKGVTRVSSKETNRTRNLVKHPSNPPARRPRAAQGRGDSRNDVNTGKML